jgi:hypothetical protein
MLPCRYGFDTGAVQWLGVAEVLDRPPTAEAP